MAKFTLQYTGEQIDEAVGLALDNINENMAYVSEEEQESATVPLNADTLEGHNVNSLLDRIYPVGSIYMSISSTNPTTLFGGTWEQIKDTFLLSAGDTYTAGAIGGEATHTLIENELPAISGTVDFRAWGSGAPFLHPEGAFASLGEQSDTALGFASGGTEDGYRRLKYSFGNGKAHNNMPPYLAVYMWRRTA